MGGCVQCYSASQGKWVPSQVCGIALRAHGRSNPGLPGDLLVRSAHGEKVVPSRFIRDVLNSLQSSITEPIPEGYLPIQAEALIYSQSNRNWIPGRICGVSLHDNPKGPA